MRPHFNKFAQSTEVITVYSVPTVPSVYTFPARSDRIGKMACHRYNSEDSSDYSDSGEFDMCAGGQCSHDGRGNCGSGSCGSGGCDCDTILPFDALSIENILLMIFDKFNFRLLMEERTRSAVLITAGLAIAGGLIGQHVGGKVAAAVGGAVGGACGIGVVAISMRDAWNDIKYQLSELIELVYDFIAGLELKDYQAAASLLMSDGNVGSQLATLLTSQASSTLGKIIISSITNN